MKVIKPLSLGILFRPYTHRRRHRLAVTALGFFPLGADDDRFLTENVQWPKVLAALPTGELLDGAMPKARGEVLLSGQAHAPGGNPVGEMTVRLAVGEIDKRLRVMGNRRWSYGLLPLHDVSAPEPFTAMPLTYDRAYGGPGYADNPTGQGYTGERLGALMGRNEGRMPNVEYPHAPTRSHCGAYPPAGFGPLDLRWPQRRKRAGTYDARWLAEAFPGLADDTDFSVFNAAPDDQQFRRSPVGGEPYRLEGLHPKGPIVGRVPEMRVRVFIQRQGRSPLEPEEVGMALETLWFLPEAGLGVAIYRGTAAVVDSDGADVEALLLAYERAVQRPRPVSHYREALALRLDPQTAPAHMFHESPLTPEKCAEEQARTAAEDAAVEARERAATEEKVKAAVEEFLARSGMEAPAVLAPHKVEALLGPLPTAAIARGDVDLSALLARAKQVAEQAKADGEARLAAAQAELQKHAVPPADMERLKAEAEHRAIQTDGPRLPEPPGLTPERRGAFEEAAATVSRLAHEARRMAPEPNSTPTPPAVAEHLGRLVRSWLREGLSLAGRDLTGAALAGVDLRGADLRATIFEGANLSDACLAGADLRGAVFTGATLANADFEGADLREANLSKAGAAGAHFRGARLAKAMALEADFSAACLEAADLTDVLAPRVRLARASLEAADLSGALLQGADASGACLRRARLARTVLHAAGLTGADLSGIRAERTVFSEVTADHSCWAGAVLRDSHLGHRSRFVAADLRGIDATGCGWRGADLSGADLRGAILADSDLGECRFDGARLDGALLARSLLAGASLRQAAATRIDLFQAICRKADFSGADLRESNLYGAALMEAGLQGTALGGARHSRQREVS